MLKLISDLGVNWKDRGFNVWGIKLELLECLGFYEMFFLCSGRRIIFIR